MKKSLYTLMDEKARSISPIVMAENDEIARRIYRDGIPRDSTPGKYPQDFAVLCLGDIEIDTGCITPRTVPVLVCKLDEVMEK